MTSIYTLAIAFTLVFMGFTILGLFVCRLYVGKSLGGRESAPKSQVQKMVQDQTTATVKIVSLTSKILQAAKILIGMIFKIISGVKFMLGLVRKVIRLRANAKRNLEARIQNQHALHHAYSKF